MRTFLVVGVVLLVSGCSGSSSGERGATGPQGSTGPAGPTGPQGAAGVSADQAVFAGSRLVLTQKTTWTGSDGSRYVLSGSTMFHDQALGIDCNPDVAADGTTRCLPTYVIPYVYPGAFVDDKCTSLFAVPSYPCALGRYVYEQSGAACTASGAGSSRRFFQLGSELPAGTTIYTASGGVCSETSWAPSGKIYGVGAEVPPSTFVQFTAQ